MAGSFRELELAQPGLDARLPTNWRRRDRPRSVPLASISSPAVADAFAPDRHSTARPWCPADISFALPARLCRRLQFGQSAPVELLSANHPARARRNRPQSRLRPSSDPQRPDLALLGSTGHQAGHRNSGAGDGHFLPVGDPLQKAREVRLGFVDVDFHVPDYRLSLWTKSNRAGENVTRLRARFGSRKTCCSEGSCACTASGLPRSTLVARPRRFTTSG